MKRPLPLVVQIEISSRRLSRQKPRQNPASPGATFVTGRVEFVMALPIRSAKAHNERSNESLETTDFISEKPCFSLKFKMVVGDGFEPSKA